MKVNEASWDRALRVAVGLGILSLAVFGPRTPWGLVGLVPLLTGTLGFCALYRAFGLSTCPVRASR